MKVSKFASALAFAATLAAAPAFAQSASGTMAPMQGMSSPAAAAPAATMAPVQSATHAMSAPAAAAKSAIGKLAAGQEFKTEAAAAAHCPGDQVVWSALTKSKSFHTSHSKYFGKTKHGAYVCEKDALAAGFHKAKN
ncbi:hypothetical protein [Acidocella sp.]|uniref:hypothetical protein n=1 Tax=Acidocella sp. TaxID=50710 RepID=UPI00261FF020|nr:hypothetical protein [Acidocella sp.]